MNNPWQQVSFTGELRYYQKKGHPTKLQREMVNNATGVRFWKDVPHFVDTVDTVEDDDE